MSEVLEKVARALAAQYYRNHYDELRQIYGTVEQYADSSWAVFIMDARIATLTLADNVSEEMVEAFSQVQPAHYFPLTKWREDTRSAITAALRAASDTGT